MVSFGKRGLAGVDSVIGSNFKSTTVSNERPTFFGAPDIDGDKLVHALQNDPHYIEKHSADELKHSVYEIVKDSNGVRAETALGLLGSLAGYACLLQAVKDFETAGGKSDQQAFCMVTTRTGERLIFGNLVNHHLLEKNTSLWGLVGGIARHLGAPSLPDMEELVRHVGATAGTPQFGVPRLPPQHQIGEVPRNFVKFMWPKISPMFSSVTKKRRTISDVFGFAIQKVMTEGKNVIEPSVAAKLVMECAAPMSHIFPIESDLFP
jgi:hypothetical protein